MKQFLKIKRPRSKKYDDAVDFSKAHVLQNDDALAHARTPEEKGSQRLDQSIVHQLKFACRSEQN